MAFRRVRNRRSKVALAGLGVGLQPGGDGPPERSVEDAPWRISDRPDSTVPTT